jgi:hypothetical protein
MAFYFSMGAIVEDVRTGFEKRGDSAVVIPVLQLM